MILLNPIVDFLSLILMTAVTIFFIFARVELLTSLSVVFLSLVRKVLNQLKLTINAMPVSSAANWKNYML